MIGNKIMKEKHNFVKKYVYIFFLIFSGISIGDGMESKTSSPPIEKNTSECVLKKQNLDNEERPSGKGYVRCNISQQIQYYRKIYNEAFEKYGRNIDSLTSEPIPGLFLILENAFALIDKHITEDRTKSELEKEIYLETLNQLWGIAKAWGDRLTNKAFSELNLRLSIVVQNYNENSNFRYERNSLHAKSLGNTVNFILYANPDPQVKMRHISPSHFVDQFFAEPYNAYIAFFDVLSTKQGKQTKKDPHWSGFNGTYHMFDHDIAHNLALFNSQKNYPTIYNKLKIIHHIKNKLKEHASTLNQAKILENGLFMLTHEGITKSLLVQNETTGNLPDENNFYKWTVEGAKNIMIDNVVGYTTSGKLKIPGYGSLSYKEFARDAEFILKDKYDSEEHKFKPVHDKKGAPFLPISYDENKKKMTRPFADVASVGEQDEVKIKKRQELMI